METSIRVNFDGWTRGSAFAEKDVVVATVKMTTTQILCVELIWLKNLFYSYCNYKIYFIYETIDLYIH